MPLPKISTPTYELTLPSNNKKIKFRPFLVREEKILLLALEAQENNKEPNIKDITNTIQEVVQGCILTNGVNIETLPIFDLEFLFLNIRSRSVGEDIDIEVICPDDNETSVKVKINIEDIKPPTKPKNHVNKIKVDDTTFIELKYPSLDKFIESNFVANSNSPYDQTMEMVSNCIDKIYTAEEVWQSEEIDNKNELIEFLEGLTSSQFEKINQFFETMPKLTHKFKVKNPKTGVENEITLTGLSDFFDS